jgi:hypothetical protein
VQKQNGPRQLAGLPLLQETLENRKGESISQRRKARKG